jgi:hypothetical protein
MQTQRRARVRPIVSAFDRNPHTTDTSLCGRLLDCQSKGTPGGHAMIDGA